MKATVLKLFRRLATHLYACNTEEIEEISKEVRQQAYGCEAAFQRYVQLRFVEVLEEYTTNVRAREAMYNQEEG